MVETFYNTLKEKIPEITSDPRGKKFLEDVISIGNQFEEGVMALNWSIKDLDPSKLREGLFLPPKDYPHFSVYAIPVDENQKPIFDSPIPIPVKLSPAKKLPEELLERAVKSSYGTDLKLKNAFYYLSDKSHFIEQIVFLPKSEEYGTHFFIGAHIPKEQTDKYTAHLVVEDRIEKNPFICTSEKVYSISCVDENNKWYMLSARLMKEIPKGEQLFVPEEKGQLLIAVQHVVKMPDYKFDLTMHGLGFHEQFPTLGRGNMKGGGTFGGDDFSLYRRSAIPKPKQAERVKVDSAKESSGSVTISEDKYSPGYKPSMLVQMHVLGLSDIENADFTKILPTFKSLHPN